ncbi:[FeFe] hydrogenase H-cluster maturation GTPase HydF [Hornefia butyriciproducens]|uniref:[FeFe] hydrogenase H-cluster maturation GTPase HydF n=1 Tax=Hornefia butyriciproducens TaxID=2652293 RepID=UPI0029FC7F8B|nr:[FeFe] hydrogenase H-cluster maturation GTPase HydF [Hornefia butyriciproducens]MCI7413845.1 [FeFe] hydrogenase H-cluster maturation GTPase HydF [Clostridiales bacterium]MDD7020654.1 [FeFe] hydrogenase H-cluster maturation GTPase HydF [Hornefia butyriciproducens]MDY5424128.1 [FeFe] hydrogenase H-cluster maturation GTPase HydF [Hornefia butyriciproducens]MDY6211567.1 [FeFe] hydrogenase H-cluster maturation GTPase HydF [Hornefia butyriciproducens]
MSLNDTPSGERIHIGFFGRRNAGKSSIVNGITGQKLSIVSDREGTTTDPVYKAMELLPLGPVIIIDTPGFDDEGTLGELRVAKTREALRKTDIAVLVIDGIRGETPEDRELQQIFIKERIPFIIVYNKADLMDPATVAKIEGCREPGTTDSSAGSEMTIDEKQPVILCASAEKGWGILKLKETLAVLSPKKSDAPPLVSDLLDPNDIVVLVIPIDESAPKGRLILPQQQAVRDILDAGATALACRETELEETLKRLDRPPELVITDSQAFKAVAEIVPESVPLTSFSILMARHKGFLDAALAAVPAVGRLSDGDPVLIAEGCTHHRQCNDIGTVKIPRWLRAYSGADIVVETCSGREFPEKLDGYRLVVHCGGCMLNEREIQSRMRQTVSQGVPFINYGVLIALVTGILPRSIRMLNKGVPTETH